jgi:hypothetical protein
MISMAAVVLLLAKMKGMSLHDWNFFLQPNTAVSVLIVVSKTSMMSAIVSCLSQLKWVYFWRSDGDRCLKDLDVFDDASRGPLGAVKFSARMRTSVPVGVLASFVTILAILMDPVSQQVISFVTLPTVSPEEIASIPISNTYNVSNIIPSLGSPGWSPLPIDQASCSSL